MTTTSIDADPCPWPFDLEQHAAAARTVRKQDGVFGAVAAGGAVLEGLAA